MNRRNVVVLAGTLILATACDGGLEDEPRLVNAGSLVLGLPEEMGELERPPVVFPHDRHTRALKKEQCKACHSTDGDGRLSPRFARAEDATDRDVLVGLYHRECLACHERRAGRGEKTGPVTCGGCHVRSGPLLFARQEATFDDALHARHVVAQEDACEDCHHVYDDRAKKLVYREDTEESCRVCHGDRPDGDQPSLAQAAHLRCVGCHLRNVARGEKTGPTQCAGCHDGKVPGGLERPRTIARLLRGQRDLEQLATDEAEMGVVRFDHRTHEGMTRTCSSCHHQSLSSCEDCHTLGGSPRGGQVTLEAAFHRSGSPWSCVGCHQQRALESEDCAGCHDRRAAVPGERTCLTCHDDEGESRRDPAAPVVLDALPEPSDDEFPRTIEIDALADEYRPVVFEHAKIVKEIDRRVREDPLAVAFHGSTDVLCAGCHHHSPLGEPPPPCRSCHDEDSGDPTEDRPSLEAAYHRQCLNCHRRMDLPERGCTDCHEESDTEVTR